MAKEWNATISRDSVITTTTVVEERSESEHQQKVVALAYKFWEARGRPEGTAEEDWFLADRELLLYIWIVVP
jgi:hypothetical protein